MQNINAGVVFFILLQAFGASAAWSCAPQEQSPAAKVPRYSRPQTRVLNPGFELGQAYWKSISAGVAGVRVSIDSSGVFAGRRSLKIDLRGLRRLEKDGAFYLVTPWLTLTGGGRYVFNAHARSDRPQAKMSLRVFNATSKEGLQSGEQQFVNTGKEFVCAQNWSKCESAGELPLAEQDNYRFAFKFSQPGVYWIDQAEISHNEQPCTFMPELEAVLQPVAPAQVLDAGTGHGFALLQLANHSARERRLRLVVKQKARMHAFAATVEKQLALAAQNIHSEQIRFDMPFADVYDLDWELFGEGGRVLQAGQARLAAIPADLPRAGGGDPANGLEWGMHLDSNNLETFLPMLRAAGIRHLRNVASLHWNLVEPEKGRWQWPDSLLDYLHAQGFTVLGKLVFTPKWAIPPEKARGWPLQNKMPASLEDYRHYVRTVIARYRDRIQRWEIWNEVNLPRYFEGTPAEYASLLHAATEEIKKLQPQAEVAGFSFAKFYSPETLDFLRQALNHRPAFQMDALSFHPYLMKSPEAAGLTQRLAEMRDLLKQQHHPAADFWITEYGCQNLEAANTAIAYHPPLRPALMNEITYAAYLVRTACLARAAGVKYFFCYSMDSDRLNRSADVTGLLEESWMAGPKPALLAYLALAQLLSNAGFESREAVRTGSRASLWPGNPKSAADEQTYLLHFRRADGRRVSVLWRAEGEAAFALPEHLARAEAFDMLGNRKTFQAGAGVAVNSRPLFFVQ